MPKYVAFLRAINVGGHVVKMEALRAHFAALGFSKVETFIASGNVIFETRSKDIAAIEGKIEQSLHAALGYEVVTFVRTPAQVLAVARYQPFPPTDLAAAVALNVGLLKGTLSNETRDALARLATDIDDFHANGSSLYWICKKRQSDSKISNAVFERTLKMRATFRNIRTLEKLAAKYPA